MKNKIFTLAFAAVLFFAVSNTQAQQRYTKGTLDMNITTGFNTGWGFSPIHLSMNYNILDFLSIGGEVGWNIDVNNATYLLGTARWVRQGFSATARADYHFNDLLNLPDQFDVYAGAQLGAGFFGGYSSKDIDNSFFAPGGSSTEFIGGVHAGGRWFWSDKMGLNAETGFHTYQGVYIQGGLVIKFK